MNLLKFWLSFTMIFQKSELLMTELEHKFIEDYFSETNFKLVIGTCSDKWKVSVLKGGLATRFVSFHRNMSVQLAPAFFSHRSNDIWFLLDFISCHNFGGFLRFMNENKLFRYPLKHLFLLDNGQSEEFFNKLNKYDVLPMSEVTIAAFHNSSFANLTQPYKFLKDGPLIFEHYGNWSGSSGISYTYKNIPSAKRRKNFQKSNIVVGIALQNVENLAKTSFDDTSISQVSSKEPFFSQDIPNIYHLFHFLNATFSFRIFDSYGYLNHSTGKFDGLVKDLTEENSQISGTAFMSSQDRQTAIEFLKRVDQYGVRFLLKKPSISYIENIFVVTFTRKVWIACGATLLIFGIMLYILLNWEIRNYKRENSITRVDNYTASDVILMSLEAVCQQGTFTDSSSYAGRILILILFTAFMFLYVSYSAYILVLLQSTKPITSIRQLVDSRIECGGVNISYMMTYYESTKDEALKELYRKKVKYNKHILLEEGLKKVQEGNFALHLPVAAGYSFILKEYTNYDICKLQELPGYMNFEAYLSVPKTSQYKKIFKVGLLRVDEAGFQVRTKHRVSTKPKCYNEAGNFQSVRIYDCQSVLILFAVGVILSFIILIIEKLLSEYTHRKLCIFVSKDDVIN